MPNQTAGRREHVPTHPGVQQAAVGATVGPGALLKVLFGYVRPYKA